MRDRVNEQRSKTWVSLVNALPSGLGWGSVTRVVEKGELTRITSREGLLPLMRILRDQSCFQFKVLVDMTAVDYPTRDPRFDVVYHRLSVRYQTRCRVKVMTDERSVVPTVSSLFSSALWTERECYDMFGVGFEGHPDLRRLLTDYGFEGHPMRKDFPLTGYTEVRYDEAAKRVVTESVERSQEYRAFDFRSSWKPMLDMTLVKGVLPKLA